MMRWLRCALALVLLIPGLSLAEDAASERDPDPWEGVNRKIFWFNEKVDIFALEPVSRGWRWAVPEIGRSAVANFNNNLVMPVVFANNILQLKPANATADFARMLFNTTWGQLGIIDIASMVDVPHNDEDFAQTLGRWRFPSGPYLVLPFFGPSSVRGAIGRAGDTAATYPLSFLPSPWITFAVRGVELVNLRARFLDEVDENRRESFDYYVFMRDAYLQFSQTRVDRARGVEERLEPSEDLYFFEEYGEAGGDDQPEQ
jgi:phospholipid-binding lipoprotein MlaA